MKKYSILFVLLLLSLASGISLVIGQQGGAVISGRVLDARTNKPIQNATIVIFSASNKVEKILLTDSLGFFYADVYGTGWRYVYAFYDRKETLGVDYVPARSSVYAEMGAQTSLIFLLRPGASLFLLGDMMFVESTFPVDTYTFTVLSPSGSSVVSGYTIGTYGMVTTTGQLGLDARLVVVPAETEVVVKVDATAHWYATPGSSDPRPPRIEVAHAFMVDGKTGFYRLVQGETLTVNVAEYCLKFNMATVKKNVDSVRSLVWEAYDAGFLVRSEQDDLEYSLSLLDTSVVSMKKGLYDESYTNLRGAYIKAAETTQRLRELFDVSSRSVPVLIPFFAVVALATAYLLTERISRMEIVARDRYILPIPLYLVIAAAIYILILIFFFIVFPGSRLFPTTTFTVIAVSTFLIGQAVVAIIPRVFEERKTERRSIAFRSAIIMAFSLACRNLQRRRLRTTLNIISFMILMFGFITLTSISPSYGFVSEGLGASKVPVDALLIRYTEFLGEAFTPIPSSFIRWLENQVDVTLIAPKVENIPSANPIGVLITSSGRQISVGAILGIMPSSEARITLINNIVTEGDYLQDEGREGVLISSSVAQQYKVEVGDEVYGFNGKFIVKGFFNPRALESLLDVNGAPMIPNKLHQYGFPIPCSGDEVIITTLDRALTLPNVAVSRVDVQLKDSENLLEFARTITLTWEYASWVSLNGELSKLRVGFYTEEKGMILVPYLMVFVMLNISVIMLGTVKEREMEIAALSSVGLNPGHIAALFIAEAAILGFVGGGLGYLLGISGYKIATVPFFGGLQVREKVSAEWGLFGVVLSVITAVLAALIPAIKASTTVTPSLLRRWRVPQSETTVRERVFTMDLPIKLRPKEVDLFLSFVERKLRDLSLGIAEHIEDLQRIEEETPEGLVRGIRFKYSTSMQMEEPTVTKNEITIRRSEGRDFFEGKLSCTPLTQHGTRQAFSFVRKLVFEWNTLTFELATPLEPTTSQLYTLISLFSPTKVYLVATELNAEIKTRMELLERRLKSEGASFPEMIIQQIDPSDLENCVKTTEEMVSKANVVCLSGGPSAVTSSLALAASNQNKMMCYVVDPRPLNEQMSNPFQLLKVVEVVPEKLDKNGRKIFKLSEIIDTTREGFA